MLKALFKTPRRIVTAAIIVTILALVLIYAGWAHHNVWMLRIAFLAAVLDYLLWSCFLARLSSDRLARLHG